MNRSKLSLSVKSIIGLSLAGSMVLPSIALAQNDNGLEEIVVTAQKRTETVQDISIAVTALSGKNLEEMGMTSGKDIANSIPNMTWVAAEGTAVSNIYIRGVGDTSFHTNQVGAVGIYVDDVSQNAPAASNFSIFDLERVEVLRGPQNTLFGRNTTGGAIQYLSKKPTVDGGTVGQTNLSYGSLEQLEAEAAIGFDLGSKAAARIAVSSVNRGDWLENVATETDVGGFERNAVRAQVLVEATDDLEILFNIHGGAQRGDASYVKSIGLRNPDNPLLPCATFTAEVGNGCADSGGFVDNDNWGQVAAGQELEQSVDLSGGFVNVQWDLPAFTFNSLTAVEMTEQYREEDTDGGPWPIFSFYQFAETDQVSQEFRLVSPGDQDFRWIAGLYYFKEDAESSQIVRPLAAPPPPISGALYSENPPTVLPGTIVDQENTAYSAYGQFDYDIQDALTLTLGLRYVEETKEALIDAYVGNGTQYDFDQDIRADELRNNPNVNLPEVNFDETWREWGGRLALEYRQNDDMMYYGSISRGFKGGGTTVAALEALNGLSGDAVDPEFLLTYELGFKSSWMDDNLRFNAALFRNEWEDQQLFNLVPTEVGDIPRLVNVPESENYGVELEIQWAVGAGWFINAGASFLESEITDSGDLINVQAGNELKVAPNVTLNGLVRKEINLDSGTLSFQTDFRYTDEMSHNINNAPENYEDSYTIVNARAAYSFGSAEQYEVAVYGRNLTDTEFCITRANLANTSGTIACQGNEGRPLYGIQASYVFE